MKTDKQVMEMIEQAKELQELERGFLTEVQEMPMHVPIPASRRETLAKILDWLKNKSTQRIGIWGMGGVGKTTLMALLNNMPELGNMFDIVTWVTMSRSGSIRKLQEEVANRLSLNIMNKSNDMASRSLLEALNGKKYLLLLDDVWEKVNLDEVGMPCPDGENGCKVVLTTRTEEVCRKMKTDEEIELDVLIHEEALELFYSKVGEISILPTIKPTAGEIVQKCGGLPLALNAMGAALRRVADADVWESVLNKMKSPEILPITNDRYEDVFRALKLSFDLLEGATWRNCLLFCGLYPEDHKISKSKLIRYWRGEGLLPSSGEGSLKEACVEGRALLHHLLDASLLERGKDDDERQ